MSTLIISFDLDGSWSCLQGVCENAPEIGDRLKKVLFDPVDLGAVYEVFAKCSRDSSFW